MTPSERNPRNGASAQQTIEQREVEFNSAVDRNLGRNVRAQLINGALGQTGFRLVQAPTFLPAFLFALCGSDFLVGLARSLQAAGTVLSPMIGASLIGHRSRILGATLTLGMLMRLQILGVSLAAFLLGNQSAFVAVVAMMTLMGFFQGMSQVTMNSLRAKVIPVARRGIVSGLRNFLAGLISATLSYVAGAYVIEPNLLGNGYATLFLLAFVIGMLGIAGLSTTREPEAVSVRQRQSVVTTLRQVPALLRSNPDFARFFVVRALGAFGRMGMPFYILYAHTRMDVSGRNLGLLTTVWMITSSVSNLLWGVIADRRGYRIVMIMTLTLWTFSQIEMLAVTDLTGMFTFFVTMGTALGGFNQASQNMVFEFGAQEDVPLRLAASGTAVNAIATIGPVIGGAIVTLASYQALFVACFLLQAVGLVLMRWVPEPRTLHRL